MTFKILEIKDLPEGGASVSFELDPEDEKEIKLYLNKDGELTNEDFSKFINDALSFYINKNTP